MEVIKVSSRGQIVIPSKIRSQLKIEKGSEIAIGKTGNLIVMKKVDDGSVSQFKRTLENIGIRKARRVSPFPSSYLRHRQRGRRVLKRKK